MTFIILSLSAILTQFETSVPLHPRFFRVKAKGRGLDLSQVAIYRRGYPAQFLWLLVENLAQPFHIYTVPTNIFLVIFNSVSRQLVS